MVGEGGGDKVIYLEGRRLRLFLRGKSHPLAVQKGRVEGISDRCRKEVIYLFSKHSSW